MKTASATTDVLAEQSARPAPRGVTCSHREVAAHGGLPMHLLEEMSRITSEIERLESALKDITDSGIREVTEVRIEECRLRLRQLQGVRPEH